MTGLPALRGTVCSPSALRLTRRWLSILLLVAVAAVLCFSRLRLPLLEPEEARYAEIPREMLAEGRWVVPVYHGQPYYDKPPLLYWLVMASYHTFGVHDWAAHLVSRLATFCCILVVYCGGREAVGHRGALAGGFLLCLSARYLYLGRLLTLDGLLCLWVLVALSAARHATCRAVLSRPWWLLSAVATGLGVLTKGPVALVLVAVPVLALPWLDARAVRPQRHSWLEYLLTVVAVSGPWYLAVSVADPGFAAYFFWKHNVQRFVAPFDHARPFWFYVPELLLGLMPWTLLLPSLLVGLGRSVTLKGQRRGGVLLYSCFATLWCLLFFSVSGCKRTVYLLPALPLLALALGCHLKRQMRRWCSPGRTASRRERMLGFNPLPGLRKPHSTAWAALVLVLTVGISVGIVAAGRELLHVRTAVVVLAGSVVAAGALLRFGRSLGAAAVWKCCGAATFILLVTAIQGILPAYAAQHSLRHQVRSYLDQASFPSTAVVCYPVLPDSVSFYLRRDDVRGYPLEKQSQVIHDVQGRLQTLAFVRSGASLTELLRALPDEVEFVPCGARGSITAGWIRHSAEDRALRSRYSGQ